MYDSWIILIIVTMNTDEVYKIFSNLFFHEVIKIFPVGVYYHNLTFPKGFRCKSIHIYDIIIILEFIHFISSTILYLQLLNISNSKHTKSFDIMHLLQIYLIKISVSSLLFIHFMEIKNLLLNYLSDQYCTGLF